MTERTCSVADCPGKVWGRGWCAKHYSRWQRYGDVSTVHVRGWRGTLEDRVWRKVDKNGTLPTSRPDLGRCWVWTGALDPCGYGRVGVYGSHARNAHAVVYELLVGTVPAGLELDHLCRNRTCVNPGHLEPVTHKENLRRGNGVAGIHARKTHCPLGHVYDKVTPSGKRRCSICDNANALRRYHAARAAGIPRKKYATKRTKEIG